VPPIGFFLKKKKKKKKKWVGGLPLHPKKSSGDGEGGDLKR